MHSFQNAVFIIKSKDFCYLRGLVGVENFHIINDSFEAATTIALLLIVTYATGMLTALAVFLRKHNMINKYS